ncbi:GntR family transcriptional regulator [Streptomyces sp. LX-29]|uniref:GntR family transcriptional regulator n=1 Tax=Streptomyces sp. LX-29 TaxID=2900152 RepID=UPI00240DD00C|nr:GntR family transcriptional regulator [Streptomyces sp. LX-29]WFB08604.1 GntR family transcriptional regulator [Streptomyces sp. LX-29]
MAYRYEQVAADLRRLISTGALASGARLPAERDLASQYRIGTPTLRRALEALRLDGLIERRHGVGTFVLAAPRRIEYVSSRHWPAQESGARSYTCDGREISVAFVSSRELTADEELATRMGVEKGTPLVEFVYHCQRCGDAAPHAIVHSYQPYDTEATDSPEPMGEGAPREDKAGSWLVQTGVELDHFQEHLSTRMPSESEAITLGVSAGVSLLVIKRKSIDVHGQVVEVADLVMAGDRVTAVYTTPLDGVQRPG